MLVNILCFSIGIIVGAFSSYGLQKRLAKKINYDCHNCKQPCIWKFCRVQYLKKLHKM